MVMAESEIVGRKRAPQTKTRTPFFLVASILMILIVFLGFLPSFYFRPLFRTTALPGHLIAHGIVMSIWMVLILAQTTLVSIHRTDLHRKLGQVGALLGLAVVAVGTITTLRLPASFSADGTVPPFPLEPMVIGNLFGFGLFAGFVAAAILLRKNTATHKRLIYWACIVVMGPALTPGRSLGAIISPYFPATFPPEVALGWIGWIALLAQDWRTSRGFHPASIAGGVLLLFIAPALVDWILPLDMVRNWVESLA